MRRTGRMWGLVFLMTLFSHGASAEGVRIKNFRELPLSLEAVTGISHKGNEFRSFYQARSTQFPQFGQLGELGSSFIMAEVSYSSIFCEGRVLRDKKRPFEERIAHKTIDFNRGPSQLTGAVKQAQIEEYAGLFWGRSLDADEAGILGELVDDLVSVHADTPDALVAALTQLCSLYGASFEFLLQ